jgi:hypothetical protein
LKIFIWKILSGKNIQVENIEMKNIHFSPGEKKGQLLGHLDPSGRVK